MTATSIEPAPNVLEADRLTKRIGRRTIVDEVSFAVREGEIFGFLGPNGAGKTTTIRMLVGLIRPTSGTVRICGRDIRTEFEAAMRCVGSIVENPDLYKFMTGRENLEHFARMLGPIDQRQIEELAELVVLSHRLDEKVSTYSLGMRQRLGIAQALLGEPRVLILDEPANGLDPAGIHEMRALLRSLAHERSLAILISSHLLHEVQLICDRASILHHGRLSRSGSVSELIAGAKEIEVDVDDPQKTIAVLGREGIGYERDGARFVVHLDAAEAASLSRLLVAGEVGIARLAPRSKSLEELFLEVTHRETVD